MQEKRQNIAPIKERILQYLDYQNIKKSSFLNSTGIAASNFKSSGLKSEIGGDKMAIILSHYSDLNAKWLLTGNGEMLLSGEEKAVSGLEKTQECKKCEALKEKIDFLEQLNKAKDDTIKAYQKSDCDCDCNSDSKRTSA